MLSQVHWDTFQSITFIPQDTFGKSPVSWAKANRINLGLEDYCLPDKVLTRQEVRKVCHDKSTPVLFGYVCAMAWGLQGSGPGGNRTVERSWGAKSKIEKLLIEIRTSSLTRAQGYELFKRNPVPGLGPAYFTKLIYFFLPNDPTGYIMDQWTAKSINLLAGRKIVRMVGESPSRANSSENYESFCQIVDILAQKVGCTGDEFEQRLFSQNGQYKKVRGAWRTHVINNWEKQKPTERYEHLEMLNWVVKLKTLSCV
jgi:hypothetical protein